MQCALKIRILFVIVTHTFFSIAVVGANPQNDFPVDSHCLLQEQADAPMEVTHTPEDDAQVGKEALPLVKVAHKNVMDLLDLFFVSKPIHTPSYIPFLQQVGVGINWLELLRNLWPNGQKRYGGGVDLHFCGPIQLSVDVGYLFYQSKGIEPGNLLNYRSKGIYGLGALLYITRPNHLSNAYFGIAYGQSRFDLTVVDHTTDASKSFVAGWIKFVGGSELRLLPRLLPQLYGGMQLGLAHLLHYEKNEDGRVSNYAIPGYGQIVNKIRPDMTLYLKWRISFLEKKIVI